METKQQDMFSRCLFATTTMVALFAGLARAKDLSFGRRIFHEKADCQFCHGIDGDERGDPRSPEAVDRGDHLRTALHADAAL